MFVLYLIINWHWQCFGKCTNIILSLSFELTLLITCCCGSRIFKAWNYVKVMLNISPSFKCTIHHKVFDFIFYILYCKIWKIPSLYVLDLVLTNMNISDNYNSIMNYQKNNRYNVIISIKCLLPEWNANPIWLIWWIVRNINQ